MGKSTILPLLVTTILMGSVSCSNRNNIDSNNIEHLNTITIGSQEWMAENLDVSYFRNGDVIFEANSNEEWEYANIKGIPAWCYYNNDPEYGEKYGKLYNYWAVIDERGLAPEGWHVPSDEEWEKLAEHLKGVEVAGKKMKCTKGWKAQGNGNNGSGFSGLPGGYRNHSENGFNSSAFCEAGSNGYWWTTTRYLVDNVWSRGLSYKNTMLGRKSFVRTAGLPVRVVKD